MGTQFGVPVAYKWYRCTVDHPDEALRSKLVSGAPWTEIVRQKDVHSDSLISLSLGLIRIDSYIES